MKQKKEKFKFPIPEDDAPWNFLAKNKTLEKKETDNLFEDEKDGELSIDVYQNEKEVVVKTVIAGVTKKDLEISLNHDMLTIRGNRKQDEEIDEKKYFHQECYWGKFSRSLILPIDVDSSKTKARLKNGVLTIILPKMSKNSNLIRVQEVE